MGWEDEDWEDDDALEKKLASKKKQDDSEEESGSDDEPAPKGKASFSPPSRTQAAASSKPTAPSGDQKVINKNSLEELELNLQSNVDQLVKMVVPKLREAKAKSAPSKFISDSLRGVQVKLTLQEVESLHKAVKEMQTKRKKTELEDKKRRQAEEEEKKKKEMQEKGQPTDEEFFAAFM
mmetsp:Transcript_120211/g.347403  ORF Transcript_120211/g.347403 Transcript_120211/m.347403 type:complete len:179 (+) Transcript_120211:124-660(+)|eukprot:CAMPEP_0176048022 /NCGR_PEP_ID=MMETSP0120_2-20121206/23852_1 /TAXON_ID=160619 /ORGANISM="Kryptoperidinium foliaceum, Strain CCMP 1326" /LENGTH=178 /DNA_ID=CAMNT_0017381437 /DNA_START=124 /DNA_END=660 /DNA_ORIENTATION=-